MATAFTPATIAAKRLDLGQKQRDALSAGIVDGGPPSPDVVLDRIETNEKFIQERYAGELSGVLGTGEVSRRSSVYYYDAYRGTDATSGGVPVIYGFSVRLSLTITSYESDLKLSGLPWIAAEAQLGRTSAGTQISIEGWGGPFKPKLTPSFDVDSYQQVLAYFQEVVETVFDEANKDKLAPTVLFVTDEPRDFDNEMRSAAGTVFALDQLADGRNLATAIDRSEWRADSPQVASIRETYARSMKSDSQQQNPTDIQRRLAAEYLGNMKITNRGMLG